MSAAQLQRGDALIARDPEDGTTSTLLVSGEPWFNDADQQWYYPIEDASDGSQGDLTDADLASGDVTPLVPPTGYINVLANGRVLARVLATAGQMLHYWASIGYALDEDARTIGADGESIGAIEGLSNEQIATIDAGRAS